MNLLTSLAHTPAAKAFGWALFHFLWQGAAAALLLAIAFCVLRTSRARYAAACFALLAMAAAFATTFAFEYPRYKPIALAHAHTLAPAPPAASSLPFAPAPAPPTDPLPWIAPFWALGVLLFHLRSLGSWAAVNRLRRRGVCAAPPEWNARLASLARALRVSRPVALLETCFADAPMVAGYLKPVILIPAGMLAGLPAEQMEAILLHELAHIRRHDYIVNLAQTFVEGMLFYHPAVWWVSSAIRAERENCCDDLAASLSGGAHRYAAALAALEENRSAINQTALAATGGDLVKRVHRLLNQPESPRAILTPLFSAAVLTVAVAVTAAAWQPDPPAAQTTPQPVAVAQSAPAVVDSLQARIVTWKTNPPNGIPAAPLVAALQDDRVQKLKQSLQQPAPAPAESAGKRANLSPPYQKWLTGDVAYIIRDDERAAFKALQTDDEREQFIKQFWLRRDPTPGTEENEYREEHYRRIAYVNEHFQSNVEGWKTDRGRIYITFGPPDEMEDHSAATTTTYPFQQWRYRFIEGVGTNVIVEFVDTARNGEFRMTTDPAEKAAVLTLPPSPIFTGHNPGINALVRPGLDNGLRVPVDVLLDTDSVLMAGTYEIAAEVLSGSSIVANLRDHVLVSQESAVRGKLGYKANFTLAPGSYTLNVAMKDPARATHGVTVNFNVN